MYKQQMEKTTAERIRGALKALGIKGRVRLLYRPKENSVDIFVNGHWFGIWDIERETFVD